MIFFILVSFLCLSCGTEDPVIIEPNIKPTKDTLKIKWRYLLSDDLISRYNAKPLIIDGNVFTSKIKLLAIEPEIIYSFDKISGKKNWEWSDYYLNLSHKEAFIIQQYKNTIYWPTAEAIYLVDKDLGQTSRTIFFRNTLGAYTDFFGGIMTEDFVFPISRYRNSLSPTFDSSIVYSLDLENMAINESIKFYPKDLGAPLIGTPEVYVDTNDDILLIGRVWRVDPNYRVDQTRIEIYCYNFTEKKYYWQLEAFENIYQDRSTKTIDGRIYYQVAYGVYCLDLKTGAIIWKYLFADEAFNTSDMLIEDSKIFLSSNAGNAYALDQHTGQLIWSNTKNEETGAGSNGKLTYYKNRLYYSDGRIFILDATTGKLLHKYSSPNYNKLFDDPLISDITIDEQTDLMYFVDGYFMMCAELPK